MRDDKPIYGYEIKKYRNELTEDVLHKIIMSVAPEGFKFYVKPFYHQYLSIAFCLQFDSAGLYLGMGTGKTKTVIELLRIMGIRNRILFITVSSAVYQIEDQFKQHAGNEYNTIVIDSSIKDNECEEIIECNDYDVFITYYERIVPYGGNSDNDYINPIFDRDWNALIIDESRKIMNPKSKKTKAVLNLSLRSKHRFALAGMPVAKNLYEIFTQQFAIDHGLMFGDSYNNFMNTYFVKHKTWGGYNIFLPRAGSEEKIHKKMYTMAVRFRQEEIEDMPEKMYQTRYITLDGDQKRHYEDLRVNAQGIIVESKNKYFVVKSILTKFHQICGGYLKHDGGIKEFKTNVKLQALLDILDEAPDEKFLVFCSYQAEQKGIVKFLKKNKIKVGCIIHDTDKKEIFNIQKEFNEGDKIRVLVCSYYIAGRALDLYGASNVVMYSMNFDYEIMMQAEDRVRRPQQKKKVVKYIRLVCRNTVDEKLLESAEADKNFVDRVVEGKNILDYI